MAKHWIKLWTEILNDPKMGRLPDWQWRRCIEMFLLAGIYDQDGLLQPVEEMAWILHCPAVTLSEALQLLAEAGVVVLGQDGRWWVKNFAKRQAPVPDAERKRLSRSKDNPVTLLSRNVTDNVTKDSASSSVSESDSVSLNPREDYRNSPIQTSSALSAFDNGRPRECERLYQQVTGQITFPSSQAEQAIIDLSAILDHYKAVDRAVSDGQGVFARWCNTQGKNGKTYSRVNVGWLGWWLADIAPKPEKQEQSFTEKLARDLGVEL